MEEQLNYLVNEIDCMKHNVAQALGNQKYCKQALKDIQMAYKQLGDLIRLHDIHPTKKRDKSVDIGIAYYNKMKEVK